MVKMDNDTSFKAYTVLVVDPQMPPGMIIYVNNTGKSVLHQYIFQMIALITKLLK